MRVVKTKLGDGSTRHLARPIVDGKKLAITGTTKREVERKVALLREKQDRRRRGLPDEQLRAPELTYGDLCERVLEQYAQKPQSKTAFENNLKRSKVEFERVLVHELLPETIQLWLARLP